MDPATILLIDRDADSIAIYSLLLRHHGYEVAHARDGETGLRLAFEINPDLVVSELFWPDSEDGNVVERLRTDDRTASIPLILLDSIPASPQGRSPRYSNLRRLTKPCEPSKLLQEVERFLSSGMTFRG